jgi:RNA polymerase sigma-70 factor, ECF subfamily
VQVIDNQIFTAVKLGDERAYERLFRSYYPRLCAYAATLIPDRDEAEEIVQTMFCRLWENRDGIDITASVQAYLFRSVRNASLNQIKKTQIRDAYKTHNLEKLEQNPTYQPDFAVTSELSQRIEVAIADLPEQCRLIFKMSRFEEMKYKEIADHLGLSVKTVENQMGKALKIMRSRLAEFLTLLLWAILGDLF